MKKLELNASNGNSLIIIGESLKNFPHYIKAQKTIIITDHQVRHFYGNLFSQFHTIEIGAGEQIKSIETVEKIINRFLELELDRSSFVVGLGGGIVCDLTGFVSSIYMRGLSFGFVPTTLLAQADASIGGKNGINFQNYKNILGVFNHPKFILCDPKLLKTLPKEEILYGIVEIIKHALIKSPSFFNYLENNWNSLLSLNPTHIEKALFQSIEIKAQVVSLDSLEAGERRKLNFGHTFGHALEKLISIPHGKAVSIGMMASARISKKLGMLSSSELNRIQSLLLNLKLPVDLPVNREALMDIIKKDKKRQDKEIYFVFLQGIGNAQVKKISYKELEAYLYDIYKQI
ncbi:MAG: 3-dehydroquinate synthase [Candidatus Aminicenantaceae bacterium]